MWLKRALCDADSAWVSEGPRRPAPPLLGLGLGIAAALAAGLAVLLAGTEGGRALPLAGRFGGSPPEVLVILLEHRRDVAAVRAAIAPERIVAGDADGFALVGAAGRTKRVVAADADAVGPLLSALAWTDASLVIATPPSLRPERQREGARPPRRDRQTSEPIDLAALAAKPTLTQAEALQVLAALGP